MPWWLVTLICRKFPMIGQCTGLFVVCVGEASFPWYRPQKHISKMQDKYHRIDKIWRIRCFLLFLLGILAQPGCSSFSWASGRGQRQRPVSVKTCLWKEIVDHPGLSCHDSWSLFLLWGDRRRQQGGKGPSKTTFKDVTWKIGVWCFKVCFRKRKGKIQKQGEKRPGNSISGSENSPTVFVSVSWWDQHLVILAHFLHQGDQDRKDQSETKVICRWYSSSEQVSRQRFFFVKQDWLYYIRSVYKCISSYIYINTSFFCYRRY